MRRRHDKASDVRWFNFDDIHIEATDDASLNSWVVNRLRESISDIGLLFPPAVCMRNGIMMEDGLPCDSVPVLIHGRHRLEALKANGATGTDFFVHEVTDEAARQMRVQENQIRKH